MISILKKKFCEKKSFEQSIQLLAKHLSVFGLLQLKTLSFLYFCFLKKNTSHTISIYGNCMTSIFLMATTKFLKLPPKIFCVFFQSQTDFRIQTNIF